MGKKNRFLRKAPILPSAFAAASSSSSSFSASASASCSRGVLRWALFVLSPSPFACVLFSFVAYASSAAMSQCVCVCVLERDAQPPLSLSHTGSPGWHTICCCRCRLLFHPHILRVFRKQMCVGNIFANFFYHEKQQIISRFFPAAVSFFLCFRCEPKRNAAPRAGKQFSSMTAERLWLLYLPARDKTSKNILAL